MFYSAGILCFRFKNGVLQVFLIHPGGPYFKGTDLNSWGIPKGLIENKEEPYKDARREFLEETGKESPETCSFLGYFKTSNKKTVYVWFGEGDIQCETCKSNTCEIEFHGERITIPEVDQWEWFDLETALQKITFGQKQILEKFKGNIGI